MIGTRGVGSLTVLRLCRKSAILILFIALCALCRWGVASQNVDPLTEKALPIFGEPQDKEHFYYPLNNDYVVWLLEDMNGRLTTVGVGPKSDHVLAFPQAGHRAEPEVLSETEYNLTIAKISQIQDFGRLLQRHGHAHAGRWGPINTDRYQNAFVDRQLLPDSDDAVISFDVYFVREVSDSPEQILDTPDGPMICLGGEWYYALSDSLHKMTMGDWQSRLVVAGPNLHLERCIGPRIVHDREGFTFEGLVNEIVVIDEPYRARALVGHVFYHDSPLAGTYVEFKRAGSAEILLTKTDELGFFKIPHAPEGEYKLVATHDGFWALRGTVIVSRRAKTKKLTFSLHEGT